MIGSSPAFARRALGGVFTLDAGGGDEPRINVEDYDSGTDDFRWDRVVVAWSAGADGGAPRLGPGQRLDVFTLTTNDAVEETDGGIPADRPVSRGTLLWTREVLTRTLREAAREAAATTTAAPTDRWVRAGGRTGGDPHNLTLEPVPASAALDLHVPSGPGRRLVVGIVVAPASPLELALWPTGPRASWLDDLPAVFRENPIAAAFLEGMLATFKVEWDAIADRLATFQAYLDPARAPSLDALRFLAGWFGFEVPAAGPGRGLADQRRYVRDVLPLRPHRGTPAALEAWLAAWLRLRGVDDAGGRLPRVVEGFRIRRLLRPAAEGTASRGVGADLAKAAPLGPEVWAGGARLDAGQRLDNIRLPPRDDADWQATLDRTLWLFHPPLTRNTDADQAEVEPDAELAERLDEWIPAGLAIVRRPVRAGARLGHDSLLGLNTALGRRPRSDADRNTARGRRQ